MEELNYNKLFYETKAISGKKYHESGSTNPEGQRDWLIRKHRFPEGVVDYVMQETYLLMSQGQREFIDGMDFDLYLELRCQEVMKDEINLIVKLRQKELKSLFDITLDEEMIKLNNEINLLKTDNKSLENCLNSTIKTYTDRIVEFKTKSILKRIWLAIIRKI